MAPDSIALFRGDQAEKPYHWLQRLETKFDETTPDARKIYQFEKHLEPGGRAETWYVALATTKKTTWNALVMAFKANWQAPTGTTVTKAELARELKLIRLEEVHLGQTLGEYPERMYTHIAWAEEIRSVVDQLNDTSGLLVKDVRSALPLAMKLALCPTYGDWDTFLKDVTEVSVDRVMDHQESLNRREGNGGVMGDITSLTQKFQNFAIDRRGYGAQQGGSTTTAPPQTCFTLTPAPALQTQTPYPPATPAQGTGRTARDTPPHTTFWSARQQSTPPTPQPVTPFRTQQRASSVNPLFTGNDNTLRPGSIFNRGAIPQTPSTPSPGGLSPQELATRAIAASATFPNTTEGVAQYQEAIRLWEQVYPPGRNADFTTTSLPLQPGTDPIGSRECFRCGMKGHHSQQCQVPAQHELDRREQIWRATIYRAMSSTQAETFRVAQISAEEPPFYYDEYIYDTANLVFEDDKGAQGNGREERE
ncbi:hypothetical protein D9611_013825 [Ephemerocybe angulata]|uniref:CCHC-type domain-containing protein n=1 Tax=Ephemerocybe angulata TaxID=980116 RepID=A0A8H5C5I1_9AGAR|nr:hypothetical protein D9611_013825 [Tulosesus angulatus]